MVSTRIDWVREHCRLLRGIADEFGRTRPFDGLTIGTGIHLEAKTVALLLMLRDGGARLISTGNLNTTQPAAVDRLRAEGVTVIGGPTKDSEVHAGYLGEVLDAEPDLILDNGGDLFARYLDRPYQGLIGGTEETTSGRMRLEPLRAQLRRPILVINDSPIKQFAENEHAVGQSSVESFLRMTNRVTNGEQVTVFGYGACGRGVAANAGHFPAEIDAAGLIGAAEVAGTTEYADDLLTLELSDGRRVHLLARGHMFNLAGPRPLGNSIESMDLGFALQARCLEAVATRSVDATSCVVPVPGRIDADVARSYLDRKYPG